MLTSSPAFSKKSSVKLMSRSKHQVDCIPQHRMYDSRSPSTRHGFHEHMDGRDIFTHSTSMEVQVLSFVIMDGFGGELKEHEWQSAS